MRTADYFDYVQNSFHARGWSAYCQVSLCVHSLIDVLSRAYWQILLALFLGLSGILLQTRYRRGLRNLPGPFLASISSLPRVVTAFGGHQFLKHAEYHKTYGPMVRVGPNHVSIADSQCISQIYSITSKFYKVRTRKFLPNAISTHRLCRVISMFCLMQIRVQPKFQQSSPSATSRCTNQ